MPTFRFIKKTGTIGYLGTSLDDGALTSGVGLVHQRPQCWFRACCFQRVS